jgi:hypothetical protein
LEYLDKNISIRSLLDIKTLSIDNVFEKRSLDANFLNLINAQDKIVDNYFSKTK